MNDDPMMIPITNAPGHSGGGALSVTSVVNHL